jgi:Rrf2 family transcriptional regulator, nitric oxide-sensitive transcriptional repressor
MISQAVEYSLRAMVLLTHGQGQPMTVHSMAGHGKIPAPYLSKLLQGLSRAGLVQSQRGVGGGYSLTRAASAISLADVVNAVEPLQRITKCPLGIAGHVTLCPLHQKLDEALAMVEQVFRSVTLEELCRQTTGSIPLCESNPVVSLSLSLPATTSRPNGPTR